MWRKNGTETEWGEGRSYPLHQPYNLPLKQGKKKTENQKRLALILVGKKRTKLILKRELPHHIQASNKKINIPRSIVKILILEKFIQDISVTIPFLNKTNIGLYNKNKN